MRLTLVCSLLLGVLLASNNPSKDKDKEDEELSLAGVFDPASGAGQQSSSVSSAELKTEASRLIPEDSVQAAVGRAASAVADGSKRALPRSRVISAKPTSHSGNYAMGKKAESGKIADPPRRSDPDPEEHEALRNRLHSFEAELAALRKEIAVKHSPPKTARKNMKKSKASANVSPRIMVDQSRLGAFPSLGDLNGNGFSGQPSGSGGSISLNLGPVFNNRGSGLEHSNPQAMTDRHGNVFFQSQVKQTTPRGKRTVRYIAPAPGLVNSTGAPYGGTVGVGPTPSMQVLPKSAVGERGVGGGGSVVNGSGPIYASMAQATAAQSASPNIKYYVSDGYPFCEDPDDNLPFPHLLQCQVAPAPSDAPVQFPWASSIGPAKKPLSVLDEASLGTVSIEEKPAKKGGMLPAAVTAVPQKTFRKVAEKTGLRREQSKRGKGLLAEIGEKDAEGTNESAQGEDDDAKGEEPFRKDDPEGSGSEEVKEDGDDSVTIDMGEIPTSRVHDPSGEEEEEEMNLLRKRRQVGSGKRQVMILDDSEESSHEDSFEEGHVCLIIQPVMRWFENEVLVGLLSYSLSTTAILLRLMYQLDAF